MKANKLKRKEMRKLRKRYKNIGIINNIIDELTTAMQSDTRVILYNCIRLDIAQDMIFYFRQLGYQTCYSDFNELAAVIKISWEK